MRYYLLVFIALILGVLLLPIFFVYSLLRNRFDEKKQFNILYHIAVNIDIMGNINGDLIRDFVIIDQNKPNLFNKQFTTISASIGHLIATNNINKFGLWFSNLLDKAFQEKNHCLNAFNQLNLCSQKTN